MHSHPDLPTDHPHLREGHAPINTRKWILGRHLPLDETVASGTAKIEGSAQTLRRLPSLFELATAKR